MLKKKKKVKEYSIINKSVASPAINSHCVVIAPLSLHLQCCDFTRLFLLFVLLVLLLFLSMQKQSARMCSVKKGVLRNFVKFTG